jgi:hypothetical protein
VPIKGKRTRWPAEDRHVEARRRRMERANAATPRDIALLTQRYAGSISSAVR